MIIELPYKFNPRKYQQEIFNEYFRKGSNRFVTVWHRRAGKDITWLNITIAATQQRVGTYIYALPKLVQAREVIWEGIDNNGMRFLDYIPPELIDGKPNVTQMSIRFKNGSRLKLAGSDQFNTIVGSNPIWIVFSEFSLQNPLAWDYLRPILLLNDGVAAFNYTPRGSNHGKTLFDMAQNNPEWFCNVLDVNHTFDNNGNRIVTDAMIEEERSSGMSEDMIEQEYYCSFAAAIRGAYFSLQFKEIEEKNNILDFEIDRQVPVSTYWDFGINDSTAIWFIQKKPDSSFDVIYYYENESKPLAHYINVVHDIRQKLGIVFANHYAPHDGAKRDFTTGKTIIQFAADLAFKFERVPRVAHKEYAIEASRSILPRCRFHQTNCQHGIRCLKEYHKEFNDKLNVFREQPVHDWASHGSDAFSSFSLMEANLKVNIQHQIYYNRVNQQRVL